MAPDCRRPLFENHVKLGKVAHIHAASPGGPRWDPLLSADEVRAYGNLLLLCGEHHDLVDGDVARYSAEVLRDWRQTREREAKPVPDEVLGRAEIFAALFEWAVDAGYMPGPERWERQPLAPIFLLSAASTRAQPPWVYECSIRQQGGDSLAVIRAKWNGQAILGPADCQDLREYEPENTPGRPPQWRLPSVTIDPAVPGLLAVTIEFWFSGGYRTQTWEWEHAQGYQQREHRIVRS